MKKMKKVSALILAAVLCLSTVACSQNSGTASSAAASDTSTGSSSKSESASSDVSSVKTIKDGIITMSTNAEFPPFEYKEGTDIIGIDVDIANKIAEKSGKKLEINDVTFDSLVLEIETDKCDFSAAGMSATEAKKKNVDFSDTYFDAGQSIIVKKGSDIKGPADLNGKTVGVQQGTTGDQYCTNEDGTSKVKVGKVKRFNKGADAVSDLISGRIDAVVIDNFPAEKFVDKNSDKLVKLDEALTVEQYAIAVKKGNKEMLDLVNSVIKDLKSSGELDKIINKYKSSLVEE